MKLLYAGITRLPCLGHLDHLESLAASFNRLEDLSHSTAGHTPRSKRHTLPPKLMSLNISHNWLKVLPLNLCEMIPSLTELDLSYNRCVRCRCEVHTLLLDSAAVDAVACIADDVYGLPMLLALL